MARTFKDKDGHEWSMDLTLWHSIQFQELGINIDEIYQDESCAVRILSDIKAFAKILMIVLEEQLKKHNVSETDFYKRLNHQTIHDAAIAFYNAAVFFSKGELIANAVTEAMEKVAAAKIEMAAEQIKLIGSQALDGLSKNAGVSAAS